MCLWWCFKQKSKTNGSKTNDEEVPGDQVVLNDQPSPSDPPYVVSGSSVLDDDLSAHMFWKAVGARKKKKDISSWSLPKRSEKDEFLKKFDNYLALESTELELSGTPEKQELKYHESDVCDF